MKDKAPKQRAFTLTGIIASLYGIPSGSVTEPPCPHGDAGGATIHRREDTAALNEDTAAPNENRHDPSHFSPGVL